MRKVFLIFFFLTIGTFISACKKTDSNPNPVPVISYQSFSVSNETDATFVFNFSDGDGDIGLQSSDTTNSYAPGTTGYYDLYMYYQCTKDCTATGPFVYYTYIDQVTGKRDTSMVKYRIPYISNNRKDKSLSGEVIVSLNGFRPGSGPKFQYFRYIFYMYDRALHKSNIVTTPTLYQP